MDGQSMLYALVIILSILLIWFVRKRLRPFSPASVFTLFWALQILFIVIGWSNYLYFNYIGILYILVGLIFYDLGYLAVKPAVVQGGNVAASQPSKRVSFNGKTAKHVYFFVLILSFIGIAYGIYSHGFGLSNLLDLSSFMEMSNTNSVERYADENQGGFIDKIFSINSCACPILGGMSFYLFENKKRIWSFAALLPQAIGGLSQGAKMGIITGTFLWFIGLIVAAQSLDIKIKVKLRTIIILLASVIGLMALLIVIMMFRIGQFDTDTMYVVFGKAISYGLGHLPAFDMWFPTHEDVLSELTGGGKIFFGITNTLGILEREGGIFTKMMEVSPYGDETNVYTIFRFFIEDFGKIGALVYLFFMGWLCRKIYDGFVHKRNLYLSTTLMCGIYFFISWSFVASIFAYATYIALMFYLYFLIKLFYRIEWTFCSS